MDLLSSRLLGTVKNYIFILPTYYLNISIYYLDIWTFYVDITTYYLDIIDLLCRYIDLSSRLLETGKLKPQKGGIMCGYNQKKGGLRCVCNPKKGEFRTGFVKRESYVNWSCSKGGLGSLFIYYLYLY